MVALRFPQASDSQKKELVALFQEALEPIRMKALTVLQKTTQDVLNAGRPFVLRRLLEDTVQNNAFVCIEPYIPSLLNLKEAPMYLDLYKTFDACIEKLRDETLAWNEKTFVQEHFGQETATVQQHLAAQLPTIKTALAEKLQRRLDNARNSGPRAKAQAYVESNGKGRMPEE